MTNRILAGILILICFAGLDAYVLKADRSVVEGDIVYLSGHIVLTSENYTCTGDTAQFNRKDSVLMMPRPIIVRDEDSMTINAQSGIYYLRNDNFRLFMQDSQKPGQWSIYSDTLLLSVDDSIGDYYGHVNAYLFESGYSINCDSMKYFMKDSIISAWSEPSMKKDSSDFMTKADTFNLLLSDSVYSFFRNVEIIGDSFTIQSDSFVFYDAGRYGRNYYPAVILNDSVRIDGDSIYIYSQSGNADSLLVEDNVVFAHQGNKEENNIKCGRMFITFEKSAFKRMDFYDIIKAYMIIKKDEEK